MALCNLSSHLARINKAAEAERGMAVVSREHHMQNWSDIGQPQYKEYAVFSNQILTL